MINKKNIKHALKSLYNYLLQKSGSCLPEKGNSYLLEFPPCVRLWIYWWNTKSRQHSTLAITKIIHHGYQNLIRL